MANRIFVCAVVVLWLGSMSWLMVDKVLPSFHDGEPPVASGFETDKYVAWKVSWSGRHVGHAASIRQQSVLNTTNLDNRVVLEDVPLLDLVPALMRHVVGDIGSLKLDAHTRLEFDSLDNFSAFESRVSINDVASVLRLRGQVNGSFLELKVRFGDVSYSPKTPIPSEASLSEALFPDAKLPYMYVGRRWHEEIYNPFRSPSAPIETVDAEVTGVETMEYAGEMTRVMRVEFRGPPTPGIAEESRLQAIAWVRADDGLVLRQDVLIAASQLRFERLADDEAARIGKELLAPPTQEPRRDRRGFRGDGRRSGYRRFG
jgi:hypothetical protein